ncbi:MAG: hypothetical protein CSA19_00830 [Deltaproteobacteria bacterium]|nr:MAG: hypothetical protein CSA19_00830 [Deltaproteobacteria bacterium]
MKTTIYSGVGVFIFGAFLTLLQIWFALFDGDTFAKIIISLIVVLVTIVVVTTTIKNYQETKAQEKDNFLR